MMRRREFLFPTKKSSASFELLNKIVTTDRENIPYYLLQNDAPFSILMDFEVTGGYNTTNYSCTLDFLTCGVQPGNLSNGLRIVYYSSYIFCRLFNKGPYETFNTQDKLHSKIGMIYNPELTQNLIVKLNNQNINRQQITNFIQYDTPAGVGGWNGSDTSGSYATATGIINELFIYDRALTENDMLDYFNNHIIP